MPPRGQGNCRGQLDHLVWADSFTVDLDGLAYQLQSTSAQFVRSAARLVHLPAVMREPDVCFSADLRPAGSSRVPGFSLYIGCDVTLRSLSSELLLVAFLAELRSRALARATDRVYLKMPAVRMAGAGVLLPSFVLRRFVALEEAAARSDTDLAVTPALTIDLQTGRPVPKFPFTGEGLNGSSVSSIDAIAVRRTPGGGMPSRREVLNDLARSVPNLSSLGTRGFEALGMLVERAQLIDWDEIRPQSMVDLWTRDCSS